MNEQDGQGHYRPVDWRDPANYETGKLSKADEVLVLYTGGTIGMIDKGNGLVSISLDKKGFRRDYLGEEMMDLPFRLVPVERPKDSCAVTLDDWRDWVDIIRSEYPFKGILVLHGTDTMAYSAPMISLCLLELGKPVLFTGAMLSPSHADTDAFDNVRSAMRLIWSDFNGFGVVMAGKLWHPFNVIKSSTKKKDSYVTPSDPPQAIYEDGLWRKVPGRGYDLDRARLIFSIAGRARVDVVPKRLDGRGAIGYDEGFGDAYGWKPIKNEDETWSPQNEFTTGVLLTESASPRPSMRDIREIKDLKERVLAFYGDDPGELPVPVPRDVDENSKEVFYERQASLLFGDPLLPIPRNDVMEDFWQAFRADLRRFYANYQLDGGEEMHGIFRKPDSVNRILVLPAAPGLPISKLWSELRFEAGKRRYLRDEVMKIIDGHPEWAMDGFSWGEEEINLIRSATTPLRRDLLDAVILLTYGNGNLPVPEDLDVVLKELTSHGVLVLNISQVPDSETNDDYNINRKLGELGVMNLGRMRMETAIPLLTMAFSFGMDKNLVTSLMNTFS